MKKIEFQKIEPKHILDEYQMEDLMKNKEIIRCIECNEFPIIEIIHKNNNILSICPSHQNTCDYSTFLLKCSYKCPTCFMSEHQINNNNHNFSHNCQKYKKKYITEKCSIHNKVISIFCGNCRIYLCDDCIKNNNHDNNHMINILNKLFINKNDVDFINNNIRNKEKILNNIAGYINKIPKENKFKEKANQLLVLLEEKLKELEIENLILMNYKEYKQNYFALINTSKLLHFEKNNFSKLYSLDLNKLKNMDLGEALNYIRSYLQNGYKQVHKLKNIFTLKNYKDNKNIYYIHNKNIKSVCALNESLIISGSWDCLLKIYNIYTNNIIYSIEEPSMIFDLKKFPLISKKTKNGINNHGVLVCLYCEIEILNIKEENSKIKEHLTIFKIKGFGNFIWTAIVFEPNKKIISACLDNRLSVHKLLPNDRNINEDIQFCLTQSNMNKEKETVTSLLQIDEQNFVSSSSLDLTDDPCIKFWKFDKFEDKFILDNAIYDVYCCQYPNSICRINKNIIGFALEYISLSGKTGGIALVDFRYKEIFCMVSTYTISSVALIKENRIFTCGYDKTHLKRYIKEYIFDNELKEIGSLEIYHYEDIISIQIINESDLMILSSDEGKITVFDNYSICEIKK